MRPHIYLEVKPRTLEDELALLVGVQYPSEAQAYYAAGAKAALDWLLHGRCPPSEVVVDFPKTGRVQ